MIRRLLLFIGGSTLLLAAVILTDWFPFLRGPVPDSDVWHWPYRLRPMVRWWPALLAAIFTWAVSAWWLRAPGRSRKSTLLALSLLAAGSLSLQLGLLYAERRDVAAELIDRTLAVETNGYFWTAAHVEDLDHLLRHYPAAMTTFASDHVRTHPPGLVIDMRLTLSALQRLPGVSEAIAGTVWPQRCADLWLLDSPPHVAAALGVWAWLPVLIAALAPFPAYALARRLFASRAARLGAILVGTTPALLLFAPLPDQIFLFLTLLLFLALHRAGTGKKAHWFFLAGVLYSFSTFLSLGNLALLAPAAVYVALVALGPASREAPSQGWRRTAGWAAAFAGGAVLFWGVYWLGWGVPPWAIIRAGLREHYTLVISQRAFGRWLVYNLVDLALFGGWPVLIGFTLALVGAVRATRRRKPGPAEGIALAVALLLIVLLLSGSARGEVGRIWLFWMPLLALAGAWGLAARLPGGKSQALIVACQLVLVLALGWSWRPVDPVIVVAERPPLPELPPAPIPLAARFGDRLALTGYRLQQKPDTMIVTLLWQAEQPARRPYTVFTHLVDSSGQLVAQQDQWPVQGQWPPTCWEQGVTIVDEYRISLSPDLPPGVYRLYLGMYDARSGERLPTAGGQDALLLAEVQLSAE